MINVCVRCANIKFHSWVVYKMHMQEMHGTHVMQDAPRPVKTTVRTKFQIIRDVEIQLDPHIITPSNTRLHDEYASRKVALR